MKKLINWVGGLFKDERGNPSSKRFIGIDFYVKNILKDELLIADYYICSGAMNILEKEDLFFNSLIKKIKIY